MIKKMGDAVILPIEENPLLTSFHNTAFSGSVLYAHYQNADAWNYNHALQVGIRKNGKILDLYMPFFIKWKCFQYKILFPFFDNEKHFTNRIKQYLESGYYIYLTLNGRYIPERFAFEKPVDIEYDLLLFGFDDNSSSFITIGYNERRKYEKQLITYSQLYKSFSKSPYKWKFNHFAFKPCVTELPEIDLNCIISQLKEYLYPPKKRNVLLGVDTYTFFLNSIVNCKLSIDMRGLRAFRDHKKLLYALVSVLKVDKALQNEFLELKNQSENLFLLSMKYNKKPQKDKMERLGALIRQIIQQDRRAISVLLNYLQRYQKEKI